MNKNAQREEKKQRFMMIAGLVGTFAGKASVTPDVEQLSVSIPAAEIAQLDLLVEQGFYSSRTEFLQSAARDLLRTHIPEIQLEETANRVMALGVVMHSRHSLEKLRAAGKRLELQVMGVLRLTEDVTPELAREVIQSVRISGLFMASPAVKAALSDRTT